MSIKRESKTIIETSSRSENIDSSIATVPLAPLVTFDMNFDTLRDFLNNVAIAINQQGTYMKIISKEIQNKIANTELNDMLSALTNSFRSEFISRKSSSIHWHEALVSTTEGLRSLSDQIFNLNQFKSDIVDKVSQIENQIVKKVDANDHTHLKKKLKHKISLKTENKDFDEKIRDLRDVIGRNEDKLGKFMSDMEKKFNDLETKTLWKLKDCEDLLKTRVNEKFVWDSINTVELRLKRDILGMSEKKLDRFETLLKDLEKIVRDDDQEIGFMKRTLKDLKEEVDKKLWILGYEELNIKIETLKNSLPEVPDYSKEFKEIESKIERIHQELMIHSSVLSNVPEKDFTLKQQLEFLTKEFEKLQDELRRKVDRDIISDLIGNSNKQQPKTVSIEHNESTEFWKFREKANNNFKIIDEKFDKVAKLLDNSQLKKIIKDKADRDEIMNLIKDHEQRISILESLMKTCDRNCENLEGCVKKILIQLQETTDDYGNALISKKKLLRNNACLSCGRGEINFPIMTHIQGFDGKFYKADDLRVKTGITTLTEFSESSPEINPEMTQNTRTTEDTSPLRTLRIRSNLKYPQQLIKGASGTATSPELQKYRPQSARRA